jgi:hypothetical protein
METIDFKISKDTEGFAFALLHIIMINFLKTKSSSPKYHMVVWSVPIVAFFGAGGGSRWKKLFRIPVRECARTL